MWGGQGHRSSASAPNVRPEDVRGHSWPISTPKVRPGDGLDHSRPISTPNGRGERTPQPDSAGSFRNEIEFQGSVLIKALVREVPFVATCFLVVETIETHIHLLDFFRPVAEGVRSVMLRRHCDLHLRCQHSPVRALDPPRLYQKDPHLRMQFEFDRQFPAQRLSS